MPELWLPSSLPSSTSCKETLRCLLNHAGAISTPTT